MSERDQINFTGPVVVREKHRYEPIILREFKSTIPPHLIAHLPDDERFIVETVSKLENQYAWMVENVVRNNGAALDLDERVSSLEGTGSRTTARLAVMEGQADKVDKLWDWKQFFSGKWAILAAIGIMVIPIALKFILDLFWKWFKP